MVRAARLLFVVLLVGGSLLAAGCDDDGDAEPSTAGTAATVTAAEDPADPQSFVCELEVGDETSTAGDVPLELVNDLEEVVVFQVTRPDGEVAQEIQVPEGESVDEVFELDAGTFGVTCVVAGQGAGEFPADGTIEVSEGS